MKSNLFEYPSFQYQVEDWDFKKKGLLNRINSQNFVRSEIQTFESDRRTNNKSYLHYLRELISPELNQFCQEAQVSCTMTDAWAVRYKQGDHQTVHNHRSYGFSGILYVEYDSKLHTPTCFVAPWQDPRSDTTLLSFPKDVTEGTIVIVPSFSLHFVYPNQSRKQRTIVAFDLLPIESNS